MVLRMLIASAAISGIGLGAMYGLLALGFYVTYAVSGTVNFAQGSAMMLGAVLCYGFAVGLGWNLAASIALALALCALWGLVIERFAVRPFVARGSNAWLMSTVAVGIVLENVTQILFGKEPRSLPALVGAEPVSLLGIGVFPLQIVIPIVGLAIACGLHIVTRRTKWGRALLAIFQNPDAARLMGIDVQAAIAVAFAVSTMFAGVAGVLIAPIYNVSAEMGTLFGIKAFAVAILGGITSAWGVMLAGLIYGVAEALITALFGSPYTQIAAFSLVILALAAMPTGLLGTAAVKKV